MPAAETWVGRFAVLRAAPDLPAGFMPAHLDGLWIDLDREPSHGPPGTAVAVATDRFERRESDGATARVYEFRP